MAVARIYALTIVFGALAFLCRFATNYTIVVDQPVIF